jgi:transcriptional regulator with XRE-family HTH domain
MEAIKRIREQRGWSQETLAAKAGISPVTLLYAERSEDKPGRPGRSNTPSLSTLRKIAKALAVSVNDLLPSYEASGSYVGLDVDELTIEGRKLRRALREATEAEDWARVDKLLRQGKKIEAEIKKLSPDLCTIKYSPDKPPVVTFYRNPTPKEQRQLKAFLGEFVEDPDQPIMVS